MAAGTVAAGSPYSSSGSQTIVRTNMDDDAPDHSPTLITRDNHHGAKTAFEPIRGQKSETGGASHRTSSRSRPLSLHSSRSYGGGDGYGCMSEDERGGSQEHGQPHDPEKEFEVHWDGDNDPMNPRSMSKPRKWLIVLILSATSLCAYVFGAPKVLSRRRADGEQDLHLFPVHLHVWPDNQGIQLLSDRCHTRFITVRHGPGHWSYASSPVIRGRDLFRVEQLSHC